MAKHRDRIRIIADVLKAAGKGARKTRIMCAANLSYGLLRKYLDETVALGYLAISEEEYEITDDGNAFLKKYVEYASRYSTVGRELESMKLEMEELTRMCTSDRTFELKAMKRNQHVPTTGSDS